jgi:hypothetical protein
MLRECLKSDLIFLTNIRISTWIRLFSLPINLMK